VLGNVPVLEKLFKRLLTKMKKNTNTGSIEDKMIEISINTVLLSQIHFGKHKG
jgi:exodeoxyribonuclease X